MEKEKIEEVIGQEISEDLYNKAVVNARKKLQSIIQRFGDGAGVRRTPGYLAELVIEAVKSELLTEFTFALARSV